MVYIGNTAGNRFVTSTPASVYSGDGSTTVFTLEHSVGSDEDILVSVDGVVQEPSVAYAVSNGTTLTFTGAPSNNAGNNIFVYYLHRTVASVNHSEFTPLKATTGTFSGNVSVGGNLDVTGSLDMSDANLTNVGSIQLDSISGDADTDTNITFSGSDVITFTTGGSTAFTANANQSVTFSGSVTGITDLTMSGNLTVDTNTLYVDSANNRVGVGTVSPSQQLTVSNTSGGSSILIKTDTSSGGNILFGDTDSDVVGRVGYNHSTNYLYFHSNGSERMRIDSSGNVGVGTTNPTNALEVVGANPKIKISANSTNWAALEIESEDTQSTYIFFRDYGGERARIQTTGANDLRILTGGGGVQGITQDSSGNVGIGTTSPTAFTNYTTVAINGTTGSIIDLQHGGTINSRVVGESPGLLLDGVGSRYIKFHTNSTERMRIDSSGRVGIGATSVNALLQVEGADGVGGGAIMYSATGVASGYMSADAAGLCLATDTAGITFRTGITPVDPTDTGSERMRIDASGRLLVGTTANSPSDTAGINLDGNIDKIHVTRSGGSVAYFNRLTSDGTIVDLVKDGTHLGSIGANGGRPFFINPTYGGLKIGTGYSVDPATTAGAGWNGSVDLGAGGTRWKDLYLSGGVYLGGVGSANKLDDYEEGTFNTATMAFVTSGSVTMNQHLLRYTKIGSSVTVTGNLHFNVVSSQNGALKIPLPFTSGSGTQNRAIGFVGNYETSEIVVIKIENNSSYGTMVTPVNWATHTITNSDTRLISFVYHTDS